jgi:hypothetical protein
LVLHLHLLLLVFVILVARDATTDGTEHAMMGYVSSDSTSQPAAQAANRMGRRMTADADNSRQYY